MAHGAILGPEQVKKKKFVPLCKLIKISSHILNQVGKANKESTI